MKFQIALKKIKTGIEIMISSSAWQKMFVHRIDEEKMREYQNQHRLMGLNMRIF